VYFASRLAATAQLWRKLCDNFGVRGLRYLSLQGQELKGAGDAKRTRGRALAPNGSK